jgi:hypothetical protein
MADNLQTTPGSGSDPFVATDQLPDGSHAQKVKLIDGTADSATPATVTSAGALKVDGSASTQPVSFSGNVTVVQAAAANLNATVAGTVNAAQSGAWTVTANAGTGPWPVTDNGGSLTVDGAVTANIGTANGLALDATLTGGSQKTKLVDTGGTNVATVSAAGALKVDGSAVTQPVSGTVTANLAAGTNNIGDVDVLTLPALAAGSAIVGKVGIDQTTPGTTNAVQPIPGTSGGLSISRVISAATTNATSVKASAGQVYSIYAHNVNAAARFLKLYNKASAPTVGTDTPVLTLPIPGNAAGAGFVWDVPPGIAFGTGIALAITAAVTDADTTAVAANEIVVNLLYK